MRLTVAWVDLAVSLTPKTLGFYRRLLSTPIRIPAVAILRTFVAKGIKDPSAKLQVLKVLDILATIDPLEIATRSDEDMTFRASLGGLLSAYGVALVDMWEDVGAFMI